MRNLSRELAVSLSAIVLAVVAAILLLASTGPSWAQTNTTISFGKSILQGETNFRPTSLQFGPDGRLYAAQQNGTIKVYTIARNGPNSYSVTNTQTINSIKSIPNHQDDGTPMPQDDPAQNKRQVLGLVATGTATNPVIYVSSSDPRIGGGSGANNQGDVNLDTNSGMISRLNWNGSNWVKTDLVRGLPRSEENHAPNGMQLSADGKTLYVAVGGHTNHGAPSTNFAELPEYALSAAILKINLDAIGNTTYDLPTLDDETRAGDPDANDPFGGNDGKNQAKIVPGGPVQVFAPGFRNPYDLLITRSGKMYTIDNSGNAGWGAVPVNEGPGGTCTNQKNEPGTSDKDTLHLISAEGYYGGHPNPTRGNTSNTFNTSNPQSPVPTANPVECDYRAPGVEKGSLASFDASTNGLAEYTATNFGGAMDGDLLAAGYDNTIYRVKLNDTGNQVVTKEPLFSTVGGNTLDVTAQGDGGQFPGTIWVADIWASDIVVFEPSSSGGSCTGADDPALDEDQDGFDNADEIDNGTDPCSAADLPPDNDGDKNSDLNDPDDDNDTLPDTSDPFAVDKDNGKTTNLPVSYTWDNEDEDVPGLLNLGFTGLMTNKSVDYGTLYDPGNMTAGGAAGAVTIDKVPAGSANVNDTQKYGFQFGVNAATTGKFTAHTRILAPFAGMTPQDNQSMGLFVGNGDQDNYVKLVVHANGGSGGIQFAKELAGTQSSVRKATEPMPGPEAVDLYLTVDPAANTVEPSYSVIGSGGVAGPRKGLGGPTPVSAGWFGGATGLAVGIISTSSGPGPEFPASWDSIGVAAGGNPLGDTIPPAVNKPPTQSLLTNFALSTSSTVPVNLQWSATDSSGSGIASYELQQSTNGGAFTDVALPSATAKSLNPKLEAGNTYAFRVRATDQAGNVSDWKAGPTFKVNVLQESNAAVAYTGAWSTQSITSASGGSLKFASTAGNSASLTSVSNALNVAWISPKAADRGKAEVWVDGTLANAVDLYSSTQQPRRSVFSKNALNPAVSHTVEVRVLGTKNASSSGTRVDVDAFVVLEKVP
jgi:hypothetical protein